VLCTSDYHLYRTDRTFADYVKPGMTIYALPAPHGDWTCVDPRSLARELVANVVYRIDPHYREPAAMNLQVSHPRVVVKKSSGMLELFDGTTLKKTYTCITGKTAGDKEVEGDRKTPEGTFHIVYKNPFSNYHLSLGLDYPNREDAQRGLKSGDITQQQYDDIIAALSSDLTKAENQKKLWYTKLGGEIFIHGYGDGRAGTAGCVALSNLDVEELYAALPLGTEVVIQP
jgi:murein L,D-transpeptidase YafK